MEGLPLAASGPVAIEQMRFIHPCFDSLAAVEAINDLKMRKGVSDGS